MLPFLDKSKIWSDVRIDALQAIGDDGVTSHDLPLECPFNLEQLVMEEVAVNDLIEIIRTVYRICVTKISCAVENGGAKVGHGSGGMSLLRAA